MDVLQNPKKQQKNKHILIRFKEKTRQVQETIENSVFKELWNFGTILGSNSVIELGLDLFIFRNNCVLHVSVCLPKTGSE